MIDWINEKVKNLGVIRPREISPYNKIDKGPLHFRIHAYEIEGLGTYSTVQLTAMCGLMKMKTIIFTPLTKDMPLLSYDLISVAGKKTLLLELYNTNVNDTVDYSSMDKIKEEYSNLPNNEIKPNWYDNLKLSPTLSKKGKGVNKKTCKELSIKWMEAYFELLEKAPHASKEEKQAKVKAYVDGLFQNGGPSTDQFRKLIGDKQAYDLFSHYLFGAISSNN